MEHAGRAEHWGAALRTLASSLALASALSLASVAWPLGPGSLRSLRPPSTTIVTRPLGPLASPVVAGPLWPLWRPVARPPSPRPLSSSEQTCDASKNALQQVQFPVDDIPYGSLLSTVQFAPLHSVAALCGGYEAEHQAGGQK